MRTWRNLKEKILAPANLWAAAALAATHKSSPKTKEEFERDRRASLCALQDALERRVWVPSSYSAFDRVECGKLRKIEWIPNHVDHVVQQAIVNVLEPLYRRCFIVDTYSGIKGRGPDRGVQRFSLLIGELNDESDGNFSVYMWDVHKYYPSMSGDILLNILGYDINDDWLMWLLGVIINNHPNGRPLGDPLSPLFSNVYLTPLDRIAKQDFRIRVYVRYCDNGIACHADRQLLKDFQQATHEKMAELKLTLNENEQIFPRSRGGIDFIGYVFDGKHMRLRKKSERKVRHAVHCFKQIPLRQNYDSLSAYWGMCKRLPAGEKLWDKIAGKPIKKIFLEDVVNG